MRITIKIVAFCFILLGVWLTSCTTDKENPSDDGQEVAIRIAPNTRGGDDNWPTNIPAITEADKSDYSAIGSLRILGFNSLSGKLVFNELVFNNTSGNANGDEYTITVKTGNYTVICVANEHLDSGLTEKLDENANNIPTLEHFKHLSFTAAAFSESNVYMPMVKVHQNVEISQVDEDSSSISSDDTDFVFENGKWKIAIERLGVKVRLTVKIPAAQLAAFQTSGCKVAFSNVPSKVFLYPGKANDETYQAAFYKTLEVDASEVDGYYSAGYSISGTEKRIILPETVFADMTDKTKAIELSLNTNQVRKGVIGLNIESGNYNIPRNHFLNVTATVSFDPDSDIEFISNVMSWNEIGMNNELQ